MALQPLSTGFTSIHSVEEALEVVRTEPTIIASFPDNLLTDDVLFEALSRSEDVYDVIATFFYNEELVERLLLNNIRALRLVPASKINKQHLLALVRQNGLNVQKIRAFDHKRLDTDICIAAIEANPQAHDYVPHELQNADYINQLIKTNPSYVKRIDVSLRDSEVIKALVPEHPHMLRYLIMPERTPELCKLAFELDPTTVQYFPEDVYDSQAFLDAMCEHEYFAKAKEVLQSILVRKSLAERLFQQDMALYQYLPDGVKTEQMACKAVLSNPYMTLCTPSGLRRNGRVWETCLSKYPDFYVHIPVEEQSDQIRIYVAKQKAMRSNRSFEQIISEQED